MNVTKNTITFIIVIIDDKLSRISVRLSRFNIEDAIEQASKVMTIRQGDMIAIDCNTPSRQLTKEEVIQIKNNGEELLYCKIK